MKRRTEISWWIPGGALIYRGKAMTRAEWVRRTWRGYWAYWILIFRIGWLMTTDKRYRP